MREGETTSSPAAQPAIEARFEVAVGGSAERFVLTAKLTLQRGVMVLFGASGCGKSLTLQAVVGTVKPQTGYVKVHGQTMFGDGSWVPPHKRNIGYVPQHHALFPFCSVRENVSFGLPRARRGNGDPEVDALLAQFSLTELQHALPERLSGGERQRVALARALAVRPQLLVLDEPFASLDGPSRRQLQQVLRRTLKQYDTPALFVTHDAREAALLADVVLPFERGRSLPQGSCASCLPHALPLDLTASKLEPLGPSEGGRRRYRLRDAVVTLAEPLATHVGDNGEVDWRLQLSQRPAALDDCETEDS